MYSVCPPVCADTIDNKNINGYSGNSALHGTPIRPGDLGDSRKAFVDQAQETSNANWCFQRCSPGNYEVRATWPAFFQCASSVFIHGIQRQYFWTSAVTVDQKNDPTGQGFVSGTR